MRHRPEKTMLRVGVIGNNGNSACLIRYLNMSSKRKVYWQKRLTFFLKECVHNNERGLVHEQAGK